MGRRLGHAPRLVAASCVAALTVWLALPPGVARAAVLLGMNALALAAVLVGVRTYRPQARRAWVVLAGAQVCSVAAFAYWYLMPSVTGEELPLPSPADALFLLLYTAECAALVVLIRSERSWRNRETVLDHLMATVSLCALSWVFLMRPYVEDAALSVPIKLVSIAYPALDLVLLVLALRLALSTSRMTPAKALLVLWAASQLAGDTAYGLLTLTGGWSLTSPAFLLWMAAFGCLAAASLHPSMARLGAPVSLGERRVVRSRRGVMVATVLVLPAVLTVRLVQGHPEDLRLLAAASVVVSVLAVARGYSVPGSRTTRADRLALARLVAGFVVFALLPLGLLAQSSITLAERAVESDARARVRATSAVSAELVRQQMEGLGQLVTSYAERRLLAGSMGTGTLDGFDDAAVRRHMTQLLAASPDISGVFVTDASGRLADVLPSTPGIVGEDRSFRDWYRGAMQHGTYVSEAYTTAITQDARVVAAASVVRHPQSRQVVGIIAAVYDVQAIQRFSEEVADAQGVSLRITDQRGVVVAAPRADGKELVSAGDEPGVAAALRGEEYVGSDSRGLLSAYAPVRGLGWTVTAQVPTATAFGSLQPLRSTVLGIAVLLGQVLLGGLVLLARTQRQRREAERSLQDREETTRGILEAAADAFVAIDGAGTVTAWSARAAALFGWTAQEAVGSPLADLVIPPALRSGHAAALDRLAGGSAPTLLGRRTELPALHRDGHEFPVELVIWQSVTNDKVSYSAFVHDISDRKRHEAQLAAARDEALAASRMKTEFLAVMSHELRTPMNGVLGMTSLLLGTTLSAQQREYAETVRVSADSLLELVNDVLDLSKVEAGRLELEVLDFALHPVVRDVVQLLEPGARAKGVTLTADIDDAVLLELRGDPGRLRQVLLNLVGNAVKFTAAGSVHLQVLAAGHSCAERESCTEVPLRFEITDTGIGITPEARERLFEAFTQADASTTRRYGGTGLGLAISKRLVTLLGGQIGVESEFGVGSRFWFTARFTAGTPADERVEPEPLFVPRQSPGRCGLVLVVDDNATNQKVAVRMLEMLGHRADVAASGLEAVDACARVPYDLVLMDCRMPLMDGYDATRAIRESAGADDRTPIVAMTASALPADRQRCLEAGMDDYLSKPVRLADLAAAVDRWLRTRGPECGAADGRDRTTVPSGRTSGDGQPVLDDAHVDGLRSLGPGFLAQLVPVFVSGAQECLQALRAAVSDGDAGALASAAHALVGSAANMGGLRVAAVSRRMETAARAGSLDRATADLAELEAELATMIEAVSALVHVPA